MKTGTFHISVIQLICPYCREHTNNKKGSKDFTVKDVPNTVECSECKKTFSIPAAVKKRKDAGV